MDNNPNLRMYDDSESSITRAGLRQTDLSTQLENSTKKKHRLKTQSILYNGAMAKSKGSLLDDISVNSGNSNNLEANMMNMNSNLYHQTNHNNNSNINNQHHIYDQPYVNYSKFPQNGYSNQGYSDYPYTHRNNSNNNVTYLNSRQQQPHQPHQHQHQHQHQFQHQQQQQQQQQRQNIPLPKQREPKNAFRESYMYLNKIETNPNAQNTFIPHLNLKRMSSSPKNISQRRFSSQNGAVMGSPMSTEEHARKLSINSLMGGVNFNSSFNDNDSTNIIDTINYMNNLNDEIEEWKSIDEDNDTLSKTELKKMLQRFQLENRSLKKKLKDIELGHDSSSIVANDEKFLRLEDEFNELSNDYALIENEMKNLTLQNKSYFNDITSLRNELNKNNNTISEFTILSRNLIEKIPNFIKQKEHFTLLLGDLNQIPEQIKDNYLKSIEKYDIDLTISNATDGNLTNDDIMEILKNDVKKLNYALSRSSNLIKQMDKIYGRKIQEERKTIIVSSLQRTLHNEFITENPKLKNFKLKNFKLLSIYPCLDLNLNDPPTNSSSFSNLSQHAQLSSSTSPSTTATTVTPDNLVSKLSYNSPISTHSSSSAPTSLNSSPEKRSTIYSADEFKDAHSTISATNNTLNSPELQYETFTN